jgi:DNA polymerase-3 subunit epsilon
MRLLGLDFETTGLDTSKERITEAGIVLWETEGQQPLTTIGVFYWDDSYPCLPQEVVKLTGLTDDILREFGTPPKPNLEWLEGYSRRHGVQYIVAHNGENFDKPLLMAELTRHGVDAPTLRSLPWIDTRTDIPFPSEPDSRRLKHLAGDHGFLNPFEHRAVFDVMTMMRVLAHYDIQKVIEYSKIPFVTVRALVSFDDRQKAKDLRYSWEKIGEKTYPKMWVKRVKENKLADEQKLAAEKGFKVARLD